MVRPSPLTGSFRFASPALMAALFLLATTLRACNEHRYETPRRAPDVPGSDTLAGRIVITGSSTLAPLVAEMARRFEAMYPKVRIELQTGGSSRGLRDLRSGVADIAMVSRALAPSESDLRAFPIALDAIGLLVHRDNPVNSLSRSQVVAIFLGQSRHWRPLGGLDRPIMVISKAPGRGTLEAFCQYFQLPEDQIHADLIIGDNSEALKAVAANSGAIAFVSVGAAEYEIQRGLPVRLLPLDGVAAKTAHLLDGSYPLYRPLHLVTADHPSELVQKFIAFCQSKECYAVAERAHFAPIR